MLVKISLHIFDWDSRYEFGFIYQFEQHFFSIKGKNFQ